MNYTRYMQSWCWSCNAPSGIDCPDKALDRRNAKKKDRKEAFELEKVAYK